MKKTLLLCLLMPLMAWAQSPYGTGLVMDDEEYVQTPLKAQQLTRSYTSLPKRASLIQYCPTPGDQGQYGTCTSWAIAYAARTIVEAQLNGCTDPATNARNAFSPPFVYAQIKHAGDVNCDGGSSISKGLTLLMEKGVPQMANFYVECTAYIPKDAYTDASNYKIKDYFRLFNISDPAAKKTESTKMLV